LELSVIFQAQPTYPTTKDVGECSMLVKVNWNTVCRVRMDMVKRVMLNSRSSSPRWGTRKLGDCVEMYDVIAFQNTSQSGKCQRHIKIGW